MTEQTDPSTILHESWNELPKVKFFEISKDIFKTHPSRSAIIKILREGRVDEKSGLTRHAMSAKEIRSVLNKEFNIKMSKTGLYFHLNTLEEVGLIFVVTRLLEGRHKVAYYSRTAQNLFIRDTEARLHGYKRQLEALESLAKAASLSKSLQNLQGVAEEFQRIKMEREQALGEWLVNYEHIVDAEGLNISDIFDALKLIDIVHPRNVKLLESHLRALGI